MTSSRKCHPSKGRPGRFRHVRGSSWKTEAASTLVTLVGVAPVNQGRLDVNATTNNFDSKVTTDGDGNVFVSVDLPVGIADELIAILRASETPALSAVIDTLAVTLKDAYSVVVEDAIGCLDLLPGGDSDILTEPAILGSADGGTLAVLLPGTYSLWDAAVEGLAAVQDYATERGIDMDDPELGAIIHPAGWMVLHHCDAPDHDFHPQDSEAGTPGAILVTRVDLELNYGVVPV
jgi:hypothetical protein